MATPIPPNQARFTLAEVVQATGGQVLSRGSAACQGVTTDSRAEVRGKLFVALTGESFDGHDFIPAAVERGAAGVLVSRDVDAPSDAFVVRVESTLRALGALARWHRQRWGGCVVAIGGSAGKTTTRAAVSSLLGAVWPGAIHYARGNLNNQVGVPMVLLGATRQHRVVVVEVGTNAPGEVASLAGVCQADLSLLTLVALEHTAGLGSLDDIENEEAALLEALGAAGTAVANGDDPRALRQLQRSAASTKLSYGSQPSSDYHLLERTLVDLWRMRLVLDRPTERGREQLEVECGTVGLPGALATLAAIAVADRVTSSSVASELVTRALGDPSAFESGRLCPVLCRDGTVVVDDTYNANPASVRSSVDTARELARERGARLVLVIGEMRELGAVSAREHEAVGQFIAESGAAALIGVSGDARHAVDAARHAGLEAVFSTDAESALSLVRARVQPGDVVLVKASRGVRAERVVSGLCDARGAGA